MSKKSSVILTRGAYAQPGSSLSFRTGTWRVERPVHVHHAAPCHAACPAGEDIQGWIALMQEGNSRAAWEGLVTANPLPAVTGRVCPHPCETACNRGGFDEAIGVHHLERYLGDMAIREGWDYPVPPLRAGGASIAVVGAGPAGLSASYHLRRLGYRVELFDDRPEAGGLLRAAIPMTRLPRSVLDAELERLLMPGINLHSHRRLGRDVSIQELQEDHAALFLGPGIHRPKPWSVDGAIPSDMEDALHLLKGWVDHGDVPKPKSVAIHGGGNTALDLARVMKRAGVSDVCVITASGLPGDAAADDVMHVVPRELDEAQEEGVVLYPHYTVQRLLMHGSKLVGIEIVRLKKLVGADGARHRVPFEGTERVLDVDMVVPAIGEAVDAEGMEALLEHADYLRGDVWGRLLGRDGVWVGGDARGDRGTVAAAVGDGTRAAIDIDRVLRDEPAPDAGAADLEPIPLQAMNLHYYEHAARVPVQKVAVSERTDLTEIEGSMDAGQARNEAGRCLSCGNCLACDNCWTLCPDSAVLKTVERATDGSHYLFDYDYCKGCGICAEECPPGFIRMVPEA